MLCTFILIMGGHPALVWHMRLRHHDHILTRLRRHCMDAHPAHGQHLSTRAEHDADAALDAAADTDTPVASSIRQVSACSPVASQTHLAQRQRTAMQVTEASATLHCSSVNHVSRALVNVVIGSVGGHAGAILPEQCTKRVEHCYARLWRQSTDLTGPTHHIYMPCSTQCCVCTV